MEILFRELLRLLRALLSALLSQSWRPLEGALGESGGWWLLVLAGGLLVALLLAACLLAFAFLYRRRLRRTETVPSQPGTPAHLTGNS